MESEEYATGVECNSVLRHMARNSHVEQMEVGGTRSMRVRDQIYLMWRVAKCNKVKWMKQSEVEWGEVKCSIGKGGGAILYGKGL
jgi:hypothetical protein